MTDKERLAFVKRSLEKIKKLWENDEFMKGDEIYLSLVSEFEWVINYAKEQAKRVEQSENQLYECPVCGFEYHKRHEDVDGGYTCPTCSEADLVEQNKRYRELLERAFKAKDLADIWDIEDEYEALEESK